MTESKSNPKPEAGGRSPAEVMSRVGAVTSLFELDRIRFVECTFRYANRTSDAEENLEIGFPAIRVVDESGGLTTHLEFRFSAPLPTAEDAVDSASGEGVEISANIEISYSKKESAKECSKEDAQAFGKVNGVYNAWPFLREFVSSALVRLDLPAFNLPLLRTGGAVALAGFASNGGETAPDSSATPDVRESNSSDSSEA